MKITPQNALKLAGLAAAAFAGIYIARKGVVGASAAATEAATGVVRDVATGVVIGAGRAVGVPETNISECQKALAEGRTWDASFACPAGEFIRAGGFAPDWMKDLFGVKAPTLNGACDCQRGGMTAEAWIGLAALSVSLIAIARERKPRRGR